MESIHFEQFFDNHHSRKEKKRKGTRFNSASPTSLILYGLLLGALSLSRPERRYVQAVEALSGGSRPGEVCRYLPSVTCGQYQRKHCPYKRSDEGCHSFQFSFDYHGAQPSTV
jgi:hypothetical protein